MADAVLKNSANDCLLPYLAQANLARGKAAVQMIKNVLSDPNVYVFGELFDVPGINQIFSYGTYRDYKENMQNLPQLGNVELQKLKHLSIVSISETDRIIEYHLLLKVLDIPNVRELEDLIIEAIYHDVVKGKLDQKKNVLEIEYAMGRDLRPGQLDQMLQAITRWSDTSKSVLNAIDAQIENVARTAQKNRTEKEEHETAVAQITNAVKALESSSFRHPSMHENDKERYGGKSARRELEMLKRLSGRR